MVELNEDQSIIVNLALDGHNIFVTGQAGVGKSEVVRHIIRNSQAVNQKSCSRVLYWDSMLCT